MSTHSEEEQIALIKDWWQRNGKPLLTGAVLALAAIFGWQAWQKHQLTQQTAAAGLYQQLLETALDPQADTAKTVELAGKLASEHPGKNTVSNVPGSYAAASRSATISG